MSQESGWVGESPECKGGDTKGTGLWERGTENITVCTCTSGFPSFFPRLDVGEGHRFARGYLCGLMRFFPHEE